MKFVLVLIALFVSSESMARSKFRGKPKHACQSNQVMLSGGTCADRNPGELPLRGPATAGGVGGADPVVGAGESGFKPWIESHNPKGEGGLNHLAIPAAEVAQ